MNSATFLNRKAELMNEILQSARSLNDNGFVNSESHLRRALELMKTLAKEAYKDES